MNILQQLPIDHWQKLKDSLKRDWPKYLTHYMWIDNVLKWKMKDPKVNVKIYCPNGKLQSGVFLGLAEHGVRFVIIFAFDESIDLLKKLLLTTKIVDWNDVIVMGPSFEDLLEELFRIKCIKVKEICVAECRIKSKEECVRNEIQVPEDYELQELNDSHAYLIHSLWPHNNVDGSLEFVKMVLRLNGGIGLFSKIDGSLVSWITQSDFGSLGLLQTIKKHQRKGFARLMVQAIAKKIADEQNLDSLLFVVKGNESSRKLFNSLGYEYRSTNIWYIL